MSRRPPRATRVNYTEYESDDEDGGVDDDSRPPKKSKPKKKTNTIAISYGNR